MKLIPFQAADLARAACHAGAILSWDTGLGKTWATFLWPLLKVGHAIKSEPVNQCKIENSKLPNFELAPLAPVLIVAPGDLHRQITEEGWKRFRIRVTRLDSHATFHRLCPDGRHLAPGFYLTSYHELGMNGALFPPKLEEASDDELIAYFHSLAYPLTRSPASVESGQVRKWAGELLAGTLAAGPDCRHERTGIRCILHPTLADEIANVFKVVVVDEGVRVKGDHTHIAEGVRTLDPDYRLVLTATPIKNRLPDVFWLAWWATGGRRQAHARFPYAGTTEAKGEFANTFLVSERNLSKERRAREVTGQRRRFVKLRAEVCNVHRLWKLFGPITLRRRKADAGVDIVPKHRHVVRVPFGRQQAATYEYHLKAKYRDRNLRPAPGAQLQALRVAAAHPTSALLSQKDTDHPTLPYRSAVPYTPKMAAVMELIAQCLERREQVLVGCAFHDPNDYLELLLRKAGIPHVKLDGRMSPDQRGELAAQFKTFEGGTGFHNLSSGDRLQTCPTIPVMLAGVGCMSEGHDFDLCPNAILPAFDWAFDKFEQFINRIHRLTSRRAVNVYSVICTGSVDRKLESSIAEKGDASALVLDGCLGTEPNQEVNLAELLNAAYLEFATAEKHAICEVELGKSWPALRTRLANAWAAWSGSSISSSSSSSSSKLITA